MSAMTLAGVCAEPSLDIEIIVAGDGVRPVLGAAVVDRFTPTSWLEPDSVAVTTGAGSDHPEMATEMAARLAAAQVTALVFIRGVVLPAVPRALVDACAAADMPLLAVPRSVRFADIDRLVSAAARSTEEYRLRRRVWFQNDLLATLADERPLHALVARMALLVRGGAILYDGGGNFTAAVGEAPWRLLWTELDGRDRTLCSLTLGRYRVVAAPVVMRGSGYWMAIASRHEQTVRDVGEPLLETAAHMLSAMRGAQNLTRAQDLARTRGLLMQLSGDVGPERVRFLWTQLRVHGFSTSTPLRAVVARLHEERSPRERLDTLERLFETAHLGALPMVLAENTDDEGTVFLQVVAADDPALPRWLEELTDGYAVGVSEPTSDLTRMPAHMRDARTVVDLMGIPGSVSWFEDVDLTGWLIAGRADHDFDLRAQRTCGAVLEDPDLTATLVAHLRGGLDIAATAEQLFLHPNSVRYRLRKAERLLGSRLTDPVTLTNLCLALHRQVLSRDKRR
ncbi:MAG: helix-turn-helix domain-containing protein [Mobilicoccus sp.]|nr:helix-turn-helix domain-containing protein [Mobilicoccus sp.]